MSICEECGGSGFVQRGDDWCFVDRQCPCCEGTGIPAATLSALRSGEMVAVPRRALTIVMDRINARYSSYEPDALDHAASAINKTLTAAKDARHGE